MHSLLGQKRYLIKYCFLDLLQQEQYSQTNSIRNSSLVLCNTLCSNRIYILTLENVFCNKFDKSYESQKLLQRLESNKESAYPNQLVPNTILSLTSKQFLKY